MLIIVNHRELSAVCYFFCRSDVRLARGNISREADEGRFFDDESNSEFTLKEIERSDDEYATNEAIDTSTSTYSSYISAVVPQK